MSQSALTDPFQLVGQVLQNEYRVDAVVGEGGFGVVYRGLHLGLEQPIAIKVLKGLELEDRRMQDALFAKFKDEAKLLYTLSQQSLCIVRSMDFGALTTPSGAWAPFMVLEWLDGRPLSDDLEARRARGMRGRSIEETFAMLEPAAQGLAVAHQRKVAHRDIKPANFFVMNNPGDGPRVKVLDFGIAKMMKDGEQAGTKGTFASFTWLYAAPEQLDPRLGATGLTTDVYAFALLITEMLTDRQPVDGRDAVAISKASIDPVVRPTPRSRGAQNVPDGVEVACRRALAVDPTHRFQTITEFWGALTGGNPVAKRNSTVAVPSMAQSQVPTHLQQHSPSMPYSAQQASMPFAPTQAAPPQQRPTGPPPMYPPQMMQAPMQPYVQTGPPMPPPMQTYRRPLPPKPAETSSIVTITAVLVVLAFLLAGSCAALHAACNG